MKEKPKKNKKVLRQSRFNNTQLAVFVIIFGLVGFFVWHSFAFTLNEVTLDVGICGTTNASSDPHLTNSSTPIFHIDGDGNRASYQAFIDNNSIGTFSVFNAPFADVCVHTPSPLSDGVHSFRATEISPTAGSVTTPNPFSFTVDTLPPAVPSAPVLASFSDSGVKGDSTTKFPNPTLTGTGEAGIGVILYKDGSAGAGGASTDATGVWSARITNQPDGTYSFTAKAQDAAGNQSAASSALSLKIDSTAPSAGITNPASGSTVGSTVPVTASASDSFSGVWKVEFQVDGVTKATVTATPFTYSWDTTALANGSSHTLTVIAHDIADNTASASSTVTVQQGSATVPSAPTITSITPNSTFISLSWSVPNDGGSAITGYKLYRGTSSGSETFFANIPSTSTTVGDNNLPSGTTYYYQVSAVNSVGESLRSPEASATTTSTTKLGDANGDGKVDALDLSKLLTNWGTTNASCDFNHDSKVDALDLSALLSHWGL
jgi:hypothetical protein